MTLEFYKFVIEKTLFCVQMFRQGFPRIFHFEISQPYSQLTYEPLALKHPVETIEPSYRIGATHYLYKQFICFSHVSICISYLYRVKDTRSNGFQHFIDITILEKWRA